MSFCLLFTITDSLQIKGGTGLKNECTPISQYSSAIADMKCRICLIPGKLLLNIDHVLNLGSSRPWQL